MYVSQAHAAHRVAEDGVPDLTSAIVSGNEELVALRVISDPAALNARSPLM
jgi:hypothetical protein